jgi:hypothetical protein
MGWATQASCHYQAEKLRLPLIKKSERVECARADQFATSGAAAAANKIPNEETFASGRNVKWVLLETGDGDISCLIW